MTTFEMIMTCEEAARFDRFFWDFVEDHFGDGDAGVTLTAFAGLGGERRIVQVERADQADVFRAAWMRATGRACATEASPRAPLSRAPAESSAASL